MDYEVINRTPGDIHVLDVHFTAYAKKILHWQDDDDIPKEFIEAKAKDLLAINRVLAEGQYRASYRKTVRATSYGAQYITVDITPTRVDLFINGLLQSDASLTTMLNSSTLIIAEGADVYAGDDITIMYS